MISGPLQNTRFSSPIPAPALNPCHFTRCAPTPYTLTEHLNGAHYMQSLDRIHRVGMDPHDGVNYYLLQCEETIDDVIDQRLG